MENTAQLACIQYGHALQTHHKPWFPWLNHHWLHETVATDMMFSSIPDISSNRCAQVYWGLISHYINIYGMRTESNGPCTLNVFAREKGVPLVMQSNNSRMQWWGSGWLKHMCDWLCQAKYTEPYHPEQNPAKMQAIKFLKSISKILRHLQRLGFLLANICLMYTMLCPMKLLIGKPNGTNREWKYLTFHPFSNFVFMNGFITLTQLTNSIYTKTYMIT